MYGSNVWNMKELVQDFELMMICFATKQMEFLIIIYAALYFTY